MSDLIEALYKSQSEEYAIARQRLIALADALLAATTRESALVEAKIAMEANQ